MNIDERRLNEAANAIKEVLESGIDMGGDVRHYLESIYGIDSPEPLAQMLASPLDCESESLCEMIFFPDETQQAVLEPVLEKTAIESAEDETALAGLLAAGSITTPLYFCGNNTGYNIEIPKTAISRFVSRLNPRRKIDERVAAAIRKSIQNPDTANLLKVKLRNARFFFEKNKVAAICDFVKNVDENTADFMDLFTLLCRVAEDMKSTDDLYDTLMDKKRLCAEMIQAAEKNEKDVKDQPVEVLMMKRTNIAAVNVKEAERQIDLIDQISMKLFGKTEHASTLLQNKKPVVFYHLLRNSCIAFSASSPVLLSLAMDAAFS